MNPETTLQVTARQEFVSPPISWHPRELLELKREQNKQFDPAIMRRLGFFAVGLVLWTLASSAVFAVFCYFLYLVFNNTR